MQMQLRLAEPADHAIVRDLFYASLLDGQLRGNDTGADIENLHEGYFSDEGNSGFWVADYRGRIVGMIGVQRVGEHVAEIRRMRVHEDFRRKGVGTALIERALSFCRERGYLKVTLDVPIEREPAIRLIEKFGFSHARTRDIEGRKTVDFYFDLYSDPGSD
jgi:GNAT superfamily N-acetyltransferase